MNSEALMYWLNMNKRNIFEISGHIFAFCLSEENDELLNTVMVHMI